MEVVVMPGEGGADGCDEGGGGSDNDGDSGRNNVGGDT